MGGSPEVWPITELAAGGAGGTGKGFALPARVLTASYAAVATDSGQVLAFNSASALTLTLPAGVPSADWFIVAQNIGAGALTVARNGRTIDAAASDLTLQQRQGVLIFTDGVDYVTERGMGGAGENSIIAAILSARPAAGVYGRMFIPIDRPVGQPDFFWDSGTVWVAYLNFRPINAGGGAGPVYFGLQSPLIG
jgi:hypothetical protein